jgi:hypothetical protein
MSSTFQGRRVLDAKPAAPALPSSEQLMAMIAELQAQNAALAAQAKSSKRTISFKVSEKGCITMLGTGQWGTTLYASQWAAILDNAPALAAFMKANADKLSFKQPADRAAALTSCQTYLD